MQKGSYKMDLEITEVKKQEIMSIQSLVDRNNLIQELYSKVLVKDEHYGKIPGTKKDTLYKSGAEKLTTMFNLSPKVEKEDIIDLDNGHREYRLIIGLYHKQTNIFWGQGVGSCSTLESKFRYRYENKRIGFIPKEYWDNRDAFIESNPKFKNCTTKKEDGTWLFVEKGQKIENEDIADTYNTVYKMAFKRALVSASISATGVSDIFTQDVGNEKEEQMNEVWEDSSMENIIKEIWKLYPEKENKLTIEQKDFFATLKSDKDITYAKANKILNGLQKL